MTTDSVQLTATELEDFQRDGVIVIRGLFKDWVERLQEGISYNMENPGDYGKNYTADGQQGHFFGDYCNWQRIPQYRDFLFESPAASVTSRLLQSETVRIFHEHVLVKEPGTTQKTPWHHDQPYYCVNGKQVCSLWVPLDPVERAVCPEFIAGSHLWDKWFIPTKFTGASYDREGENMATMPDIDQHRQDYRLLSYELEPGDCIAFHFLTVHGAPENLSTHRRRAFSARLLGDDATYVVRNGEMSPPFPGLENRLVPGGPMDADEFPKIYG